MPHWRDRKTSVSGSSKRAHGLWRKVTCSVQSQLGLRRTTSTLLMALAMVSLLIWLMLVYAEHTVPHPKQISHRLCEVVVHYMDGLLRSMGSSAPPCNDG